MSGFVKIPDVSGRFKSLCMMASAIIIVAVLAGCGSNGEGDDGSNNGHNDSLDEQDNQLRILASVVDDQGFVVPGATVSFETENGGAYLISDEQGQTEYTSSRRQDLTVAARADGYLSQVRPLSVPEDASLMRLDFVLKTLPEADTLAGAEMGIDYRSDDGTGVELAAGTLVDDSGVPVVGDVEAQLGSLAFDDAISRRAFPGAFVGEDDSLQTTRLAALAAGDFRFSQSGEPLALSFGQTATVVLPLTVEKRLNDQPLAVGQLVPLWSLDENTGLWQQEGDGMVIDWEEAPIGLAVQATVSHFSWWLAAEPLGTVSTSVGMACPESDSQCQSLNLGGQIDFEAAEDGGPWYAQRVYLSELNEEAAVATELPALPVWVYGFDATGGYGGTNPEAIGGTYPPQGLNPQDIGGTYPPQHPLTPQADEPVRVGLQPAHEILPDWPAARGRLPLTGLLSSLNETHEYDLDLRPNDELLLEVTRIDRLDFDPDSPGAGAGLGIVLKDPNGIVLFDDSLDSGGPLVSTVPVDTAGKHRLSLVGISNEQGGYAASTRIKRGPRPIVAQCVPYDPEPDSAGGGGSWSGPGDAKESGYSIPASQRGGGIISATLSAGHPDIEPRLKACTDSACTGGSVAGDTGSSASPAAQIKFEAKVGVDYTFHIEQFGNAPVDDYPQGYSLSIDFSPRVDCWEPNDTAALAKSIELDEVVEAYMLAGFESSSIPSGDYVDWYAIDLRHSGTVQAVINPPAGNHLMRVRMGDELGNAVTLANQQGSVGEAFTVESNREVDPGIYYLRVGVLVGDDRKVDGDGPPPAHWSQQYSMTVTRQ